MVVKGRRIFMEKLTNKLKRAFPKRQTVFKVLTAFLIVSFFMTYVGYALSHQKTVLPDNPLEDTTSNSSRVPLVSDYKHLVHAEETRDSQSERENKEDKGRKENENEEEKNDQQEFQYAKKEKQSKEGQANQQHGHNSDGYTKGENAEGQGTGEDTGHSGEGDQVDNDSPHIEIKDPDHVTDGNGLKENDYFTTTIVNGEVVTDEEYSFRIKQKEHDYIVKQTEVFVNEQLEEKFKGSVTLVEGENTITVKVTYEDKDGKTFSVSKTYTVTLKVKEIIIYSDLEDKAEVNKQELSFKARAEVDGEEIPITVLVNDDPLKEVSTHQYEAVLHAGENHIVISAEHEGKKAEKAYTVFYHKQETELTIDTDLEDQEVSHAAFSFFAVAKDGDEKADLSVTLNDESIEDDGKENYSVTLSEGTNFFTLTAKSGEKTLTQTYTVTYAIPQSGEAEEEDGDETDNILKIIVPDLEDGQTLRNRSQTFHVEVVDDNGKQVQSNHIAITVTNNGKRVPYKHSNGTLVSYSLNVQNGPNHIEITAIDQKSGSIGTYELTVYGEIANEDEKIGSITFSLEASTIGLGYIIPPQEVDLYPNEPGSRTIDRVFKEYGIEYDYTGKHENSFYLEAIYKPGLVTNPVIPADLAELVERDFELNDYYPDSLGEFNFSSGSGWMYSVDGHYPNVGFADYYFKDGQVVRIRFTLAYGADIGGGSPGTNYHKEW